jgi:hypothetical protein
VAYFSQYLVRRGPGSRLAWLEACADEAEGMYERAALAYLEAMVCEGKVLTPVS